MNLTPYKTVLENLHLPKRYMNKIKKDLDYILQKNINSLELIVLFGSCAGDRLKVTSDIDLLIVTKEKLDRTLRGDIAAELSEPVRSVTTDVIFYTIDEIRTGKSLLLKQIMKEGIVIWKKD